jgi:hypothetical protein
MNTVKPRTNAQNKQIHALISKQGIDADTKAGMCMDVSSDRCSSTSDLFEHEAWLLISALNRQVNAADNPAPKSVVDDKLQKQRRRVIAKLASAGYVTPLGKADMEAINQWVLQQKFKKKLNDHSSEELSKLIYAAEQVYKHFISKV